MSSPREAEQAPAEPAREGPLAETLARLDADHEYCNFGMGRPDASGWTRLADLTADDALLAKWFDALLAAHDTAGGERDVAGSFLAGWIAEIVVDPVVASLHAEQRAWPLAPAGLWVHRDAAGWFDGLRVEAPLVYVVDGDPHAGHEDTVVVDSLAELHALVAAEATAVLDPIFAAVRRLAPFGRRGMWGGVADAIASSAVAAALRHRASTNLAFDDAAEFIAALAARAPLLRVRPTKLEVARPDGTGTVVARRGTCCLYYKIEPGADPAGEGYCTSCPLLEPASQQQRFATWLDEVDPR